MLAAIWCSTKKAPPVVVLEPILKEIILLESEGRWFIKDIYPHAHSYNTLCMCASVIIY